MSVSVIVETRAASVIDSGTVYGPPPTRKACPGVMMTCADPMPADTVGTAGGSGADVSAAATAGAGGSAGGCDVGSGGTGVGGAGTRTVPGTGDDPGGTFVSCLLY